MKMISKYGEVFEFNIFSVTLGASRLHIFIYSKFKTRIDVQRCLVKVFQYIGGVPKELLTDNMSSIVNTNTKEFLKEFVAFSKDMDVNIKKCKPRHPYTKSKDCIHVNDVKQNFIKKCNILNFLISAVTLYLQKSI